MNFHTSTVLQGYIPSLCSESPTHLAVMAAAISGTMYCRPPVSSNMMTTRDTITNTPCYRYQLMVKESIRDVINELTNRHSVRPVTKYYWSLQAPGIGC